MNKRITIGLAICCCIVQSLHAQDPVQAQDSTGFLQHHFTVKGQLSAYTHLNLNNKLPWWNGGRYIPQLNFEQKIRGERMIDLEASANLYGNAGWDPGDSSSYNGDIKPYRIWARYSTNQFELRAGLQKINFGSASILRPLMWFDQIDPRDPLKLTDGVWGLLARYYFLNNTNIWFWGLYGNQNRKGWEAAGTARYRPELGGRVQVPVPRGEAAFSYHHRMADWSDLSGTPGSFEKVPENRFGLDARFDVVIGFWLEASWSHFNEAMGAFTNQEIINVGMDYTFGVGNGLTVVLEQLLAAYDEYSFRFDNAINFSLLNLSYPVGMFDYLNAIVYVDWTNSHIYSFLNWQRQFNRFTLYLMGYVNPKDYNIPTQMTDEILYAGSGLQLMLVFNH